MRFVVIYRWTPQTFRVFAKRYITLLDGTAPEAVQEASKKYKLITVEISATSQMIFNVGEVADEDVVDLMPLIIYMQEVCVIESHVVQSFEDWSRSWDKLEILDKVPPPEW